MKIEALGRHIIVEYYNCNSEKLKNPKLIEKYMCEAAKLSEATIITSSFHHFNPWGVSGAVIIAESHLTIHTWPEYGYAAVDLFTCGDIKSSKAFNFLEEAFEAKHIESVEFIRGTIDKIQSYSSTPIDSLKYKITDMENI